MKKATNVSIPSNTVFPVVSKHCPISKVTTRNPTIYAVSVKQLILNLVFAMNCGIAQKDPLAPISSSMFFSSHGEFKEIGTPWGSEGKFMEHNISMCKSVLSNFDKLKFNIWMFFTASELSFLSHIIHHLFKIIFSEFLTSDWCSWVKFNKSIWWHLLYKLSLSDAKRSYLYLCLHDWLYCCQLD